MADFRCLKCNKKQNDWELDFRQKKATCKTCAPSHPEERVQGPWLMKNGQPRLASEMIA